MKASFAVLFTIAAAALPHAVFAQGVRTSSLRAGAAKVDVTPAERDLPKNYDGILDHLYSRAIVLESGNTSAVRHRSRRGAESRIRRGSHSY